MSDDMFARWARRKEQVAKAEAEAGTEAASDEAELDANRMAAEAVDLDTLGPDSDLSVFLRRGVPELLRTQALRAVWRSDPVFANLDGMVDYGEDFGRKDLIMETFQSAWQAGRGYLEKTVEETTEDTSPEEPADAPREGAEDATAERKADRVVQPVEAEPLASAPPPEPEITIAETHPEPQDAAPKVSLRRRMGV